MIKSPLQSKVDVNQEDTMKKIFTVTILSAFVYLTGSCQKEVLSREEQDMINKFNDYNSYVISAIKDKAGITDSLHLHFIMSHFIFIDSAGNNKPSPEQIKSLKSELDTYYRYLQEREDEQLAENLKAIPFRLGKDTFIYSHFTRFQKENSLVFYDKRSPTVPLGYLLFMPPIPNKNTQPLIWSWTLVFRFGKFMFKALTGEEGYEYIFKSVNLQ